jgi:hypothetical protein
MGTIMKGNTKDTNLTVIPLTTIITIMRSTTTVIKLMEASF